MATLNRTLTTITGPASEPVTLDEAKDFLRVDFNDDDVQINALIKASRQYAEAFTNLHLFTQTVELTFNYWPSNIIDLDVWPLQSVDSVKYYDTSSPSTQITLTETADYYTDINVVGGQISNIGGWPSTYDKPTAIAIRMTAGYSAVSVIPEDIKEGIKAYTAYLYEHDETYANIARAILWPQRRL